MGLSYFTRRYFRNHSYFLFLRLVICLNSAGSPARLRSCIKLILNVVANFNDQQITLVIIIKIRITLRPHFEKCDGPTVNTQHINDAHVNFYLIVDPQANVAPGIPEAAICVQVIAAQYILQFAIVIALCCALHRFASRVIHRSE